MADLSKLRKKSSKGTPPAPTQPQERENTSSHKGSPPEDTNGNLSEQPRGKPVVKAKIEFSVPEEILNEFALEAGRRFGFKKGCKSDLFVAMWGEYKARQPR